MSNRLLLNNLNAFLDTYQNWQDAQDKRIVSERLLKQLQTKPTLPQAEAKYAWFGSVSFYLAGLLFVVWVVFSVVFEFLVHWDFKEQLIAAALFVFIDLIFWLVEKKKENRKINSRNSKNFSDSENYYTWWQEKQKYIPALIRDISIAKQTEEKCRTELVRCGNSIGLHEKYQDDFIVKRFISYLEEGRCDTLKECINLYVQENQQYQREEAEFRHQKRMETLAKQQLQQLNEIKDETSRSTVAAEKAAKSADDAAFWGVVTAYEVNKLNRDK